MSKQTAHDTTGQEWLTTKQAGEYVQYGRQVIYAAVKRGHLRASRVKGGSRRYRFLREWLDAWLEASAPEIVNPDAPAARTTPGTTRH